MAKEGFFGEAGKNTYSIPGVTGFFSNEVNKKTGVTQVYIQGPLQTQKSVGTFNSSTGKFTPDANSSLTQQQITKISSTAGLNAIKGSSNTTVTKDLIESGVSPKDANTQATRLLSPNTTNTNQNDEQKLTSELSSENGSTRNQFPGSSSNPLRYPLNLKSELQDVIKFRMVKYSPKKFEREQLDKDLNPFSDRRKIDDKNTIGVVVLPIPSGISDNNSVSWSQDTLNPLQANLVNLANTSITQGFGAGADVAEQTSGNVSNNSSDVKAAVASVFAEAATGTTNLLSRTRGAIYNPNMELLFNAPTLRPFNFTFKLSARSKEEAQAIRSIIRFFKQGMSPIRTQSQLFLKAPHTFQLEYLHKNLSHGYLNKFKECALQSFTVDYTPEGQYATFSDGAMVSYQITMQFQELEPVFNDDYTALDGNADTQIGY